MTLLPIIYTSLLLFFGILMVVIAISYMVFKARKNTNPLIEEEIKKQKNYLNIEKQNRLKINLNKTPEIRIVSNSKSLQSPINQFPNEQIQSAIAVPVINTEKKYNGYAEERNRFDNDENYYSRQEVKSKDSKKHRNSRLEILNDSTKFRKKKIEYENEELLKKNLPDFTEYNFINFYSDQSLNNFSNVTAAQSKSA